MQVNVLQVIIITFIAGIYRNERLGTQVLNYNAVFWSWVVGLIMGDGMVGIQVGAAVQLMSLGVAALAGSSVPDYPLAGMVGTVISIVTGQDASVGLTVGVAVGMLGVQLDVLAKLANNYMAHKQHDYALAGEYGKMERVTYLGVLFYFLEDAIPMLIVLLFGGDVVSAILNVVPAWFTGGLKTAAGMLPAIGMAALLNYMPTKTYFSFLAIGFVLSAYVGLGILPIAILGGAAAYEVYKRMTSKPVQNTVALEEDEDE